MDRKQVSIDKEQEKTERMVHACWKLLDSQYIGVYVVDGETEELYFANNTMLDMA